MKYLVLFGFIFSMLGNLAVAATDVGARCYMLNAENVYLVRVTSVKDQKVTFTITEVLKGKATQSPLVLTEGWDFTCKENSEWMLVSMRPGGRKNGVGGVMNGWSDWYPTPVSRDNNQVTIARVGSLDYVKELLKESPHAP